MATEAKFCSQCGTGIGPESRFCTSCGFDLTGEGGPPVGEGPPDMIAELEGLLRKATKGEYEIEGLLGQGGMAVVFKAKEIMLDRPVAIKVLPPELAFGPGMIERFKREARTAAQLNHPNIIPIYRVGEAARTMYFVMKYVEGRTLDGILDDAGRLEHPVAALMLQQVCAGLSYAHKRGVIHRDMKPSNVMIDDEGWALLMDFGIAKAAGSSTLTATGAALGTPYYMSPEQGGGKPVTPLSDQYALGVMAYQMLSGSVPFEGETVPEIITKHFFEEPRPLSELCPDCPERFRAAVHRAMAKKPEERFATLEEFVAEITAGEAGEDEAVRTQMVDMAKTVPGDAVPRVATPLSPIPPAKLTPAGAAPSAAPPSTPRREGFERSEAVTSPMEVPPSGGAPPDVSEAPTSPVPVSAEPSQSAAQQVEPARPSAIGPLPASPAITPVTPVPTGAHPKAEPRKKPWIGIAAAVVVLAGGGVGTALFLNQGTEDTGGPPREVAQTPATQPPEEPKPETAEPGPATGPGAAKERPPAARQRQPVRATPRPPAGPPPRRTTQRRQADTPRQADQDRREAPTPRRVEVPRIAVPTVPRQEADTAAPREEAAVTPERVPTAQIVITNPVRGLTVTVNRRRLAEPTGGTVPAGDVVIVLRAPGYKMKEYTLTLTPNQIRALPGRLERRQ